MLSNDEIMDAIGASFEDEFVDIVEAYLLVHGLERSPLDCVGAAVMENDETPSRTPAPVSDRPELSKVDYILSQRNSNPGQGYYFPPEMTTAEDRQHAQGIENNIGNSEPFLSKFNAYKSKHGYR